MKTLPRPRRRGTSSWGSVRRWEAETRERLRRHHWLWLHGWCIGLVVLAFMWAAAHLQMVLGSDSLALRYLVTLGIGYLAFLGVLRWWASNLVDEGGGRLDKLDVDLGNVDLPLPGGGGGGGPSFHVTVPMGSGGGGDFAGGGAEGVFADIGDAAASALGDASDSAGSVAGEVASGALEAVGSADDAAVVVVPVLVVFLAGCLVVLGAGSLLLLYFGSDVLLAVAVELAFGYVSARTAVRVAREGWLTTAVRLTWKPLLGTLLCAVLLGGLLDWFVPQARSLPDAISVIRGK